jgi:hypothetical protein
MMEVEMRFGHFVAIAPLLFLVTKMLCNSICSHVIKNKSENRLAVAQIHPALKLLFHWMTFIRKWGRDNE